MGYVNTDHFVIGMEVELFGISFGPFYGDLNQGLALSIDVKAAKGKITIHLGESDIRIDIDLPPMWVSGKQKNLNLIDTLKSSTEEPSCL